MTESTTNSINNATQSLQLLSNTGILDPNGNVLLSVYPVASAINNLVLRNAAIGVGPTLLTTSNGSDANVDLNISCKGTGKINLGPASTTSLTAIAGNVIQFNNTANTYSATLNASTCTSNANYTLPQAAPASTSYLNTTSAGVMSWVATIPVANGGTANTTFTAYTLLCAGTTTTGAFQNVASVGSTNQLLTSAGASALPVWTTATYPATTTINQLLYSSAANTVTGLATVTTAVLTTSSGVPTWASQLSLTLGGANNSLVASAGGIVWSDSTKLNILSGTATANQVLLSGASVTPAWSTATYPASTTINQLLYSSAANTVTGLATANSAGLLTDGSGVPSWVTVTGTGAPVLATSPQFTNYVGIGTAPTTTVGLYLLPTISSTTDDQENTILYVSGYFNISATALNNDCYGISIFTVTIPNEGSITNYYGISSQALISNVTAINNYYGGYFKNATLVGTGTITNTVALYADNMAIGVTATTPPTSGLVVSGSTILTGGIVGVSNASAPTAGNVGEEISSVIPDASHISLSTGATTTITSISLTAGDWLVYGNVSLANSNGSITGEAYGWTTTTALTGGNLPDPSVSAIVSFSSGAAFNAGLVCPFLRVNVNTTTTVYLQARSTFIAGTTYATGGLYAMRNR